jgi:bacteriocin biosynthesis cyclodehydratase domain-containing protein
MHARYDRPTLLNPGALADRQARAHDLCGEDRLLEALVRLLDGTRSTETLYGELLLAGFELESILAAMNWLDGERLLGESPESVVSVLSDSEKERYAHQMKAFAAFRQPQSSSFSSGAAAGLQAQAALKRSVVAIVGLGITGSQLVHLLTRSGLGQLVGIRSEKTAATNAGSESVDPWLLSEHASQHSIRSAGFTLVDGAEELTLALENIHPDLLIYSPDRFDEAVCRRLNDLCLSRSVPLLIYRRRSFDVELGPLVVPRQTACYVCYDLRRKAALSESEALMEAGELDPGSLSFPVGAEWLALEAVKFLTRVAEPVTRGRLSRFNVLTGLMTVHPVLKLPRCPACGVHRCRPTRKLWEE